MESLGGNLDVSKKFLKFRFKNIKLENFPDEGILLCIPFLKTDNLIQRMDSIDAGKLKISKEWVASFISDRFIDTSKSKVAMVVECMISFCAMTYPSCPNFGDSCFQLWLTYMTLAVLMDDIFDDSNYLKMEAEGNSSNTWRAIHALLSKMIDLDESNRSEEMEQSLKMLMKLDSNPKIMQIFAAMRDFADILKSVSQCQDEKKLKADMIKVTAVWIQTSCWGKTDNLQGYNETTYRVLRRADYSAPSLIWIIATLEGISLPESVTINPQLIQLLDLVGYYCSTVNDIFGLQKDVEEMKRGDCIGMLVYKLKNGLELKEAMDQEIKLMGENIDDYIKVRKCLLNLMKGSDHEDDFKKYIRIIDSFMGGHPFGYANSIRYKGNSELVGDVCCE